MKSLSDKKIEVLYISGCDRSGSTVLDRVLGQIEGFFGCGEIWHFFGRGMTNNELCGCGKPFRKCELWMDVAKRYENDAHAQKPEDIERLQRIFVRTRYLPMLISSGGPSRFQRQLDILRAHLGSLYLAVSEVTGAHVIVDSSKNPVYAHVLGGVDGIGLSVVHLVRDGRGVAYSWSKKRQRPEVLGQVEYMDRHGPVRSSAYWVAAQLGSETLKLRYPYMRIRYEDFIREPKHTTKSLLEFLGHPDLALNGLKHIKEEAVPLGVQHTISGNPMRMEQKITLRMDCEWLGQMKKSDKWLVGALTLPLLVRYGYFRGGASRCDSP